MSRKAIRVALVEVPGVDLEMDGERLHEDFSLNHPKYTQLVLAANLRNAFAGAANVEVDIVDLKGRAEEATTVQYGVVDYCGRPVSLYRVGLPFEAEAGRLKQADIVA